ncbi:MAG: YrhA family protein [Prevotella sp.]|jgi:tetratricopeptide (TPR) repeat protein|nr:YrhA family protein [Prevotella sp.]
MEKETLSQAVRRLSKKIEEDPGNAELYFERGMAYFDHENWYNAEDDFSQALTLNPKKENYLLQHGISYFNQGNWDAAIIDFQQLVSQEKGGENHDNYLVWLRKSCMQKQDNQTIEERMAPYAVMIEKLKEEVSKQRKEVFSFDQFLELKCCEDYTELVAAMAFFEEYELLKRFLEEKPAIDEEFEILNSYVRPQFAHWMPTPLYFITGYKTRVQMTDPCKMLHLLKAYGGNANMPAGDGSTPLWNQTTPNGVYEIMQTLLKLGANPNQISIDGEYEWAPLASCLMPNPDENNEESWLPFDALSIKKAKLLLEYGADPNLVNPSFPDYPPLMLAIQYGFPLLQKDEPLFSDTLQIIELLLKCGADPDFTDCDGFTPLYLATEYDLLEVGQLLLLYGATIPEEEENTSNNQHVAGLRAIEDCYFRPGSGEAWQETAFFSENDIYNPKTNILKTNHYKIVISEKTATSLNGEIFFEFQNLKLFAGKFAIDIESAVYSTESQNVAYDTHMRLTLELVLEADEIECEEEDTDTEPDDNEELKNRIAEQWGQMREKYTRKPDLTDNNLIVKILRSVNKNHGAMLPRPAVAEDLVLCDLDLAELDFPELPDDYANFLKIHGGFAFNSIELYGTDIVTDPETDFQLIDIVTATEDFNDYYIDEGYLDIDYPLLCFGRKNGDYFTYDPQINKYQVRSHESIGDIWEEYDTFDEFFINEIEHYC